MSLHILIFNFQLCSVPEIYTSPTELKVIIHIRICYTCHKTINSENIINNNIIILLASDESMF